MQEIFSTRCMQDGNTGNTGDKKEDVSGNTLQGLSVHDKAPMQKPGLMDTISIMKMDRYW
jgi:hypothetical protein